MSKAHVNTMKPMSDKIMGRIRQKKRGWVFTSRDFLDMGNRKVISRALSQLVKRGVIRRLDRGIYDYPRQSNLFGTLFPDVNLIAHALAAGDRIFPSGAMAANWLGLSTQVPAKPYYLTNATTLTRRVGNYTIVLERTRVPLFNNVSDNVNLLIQAFSYFGERGIDDHMIKRCSHKLTDCDLADLRCHKEQLPKWMGDIISKIEHRKFGR